MVFCCGPLVRIEKLLEEKYNNIGNNKYFLFIEGYSILSRIGFIKVEVISGDTSSNAINKAYNKIFLHLFKYFNIIINEMMTSKLRILPPDHTIKSSGFAFYPLTNETNETMHETIQEFREDEERNFMLDEDKKERNPHTHISN